MLDYKDILLKSVGENLRKLRVNNNKNYKEVAFKLGITQQAYGNMERGKTDITLTRIFELADFYQVECTEILQVDFNSKIFADKVKSASLAGDPEKIKAINNLIIHKYNEILHQIKLLHADVVKM